MKIPATWAPALLAFGIGCAAGPGAKKAPTIGKPPAKPDPASHSAKTGEPFLVEGPYGLRRSVLLASAIPCGAGMCGSLWNDSNPYEVDPSVAPEPLIPERHCGTRQISGLLLGAFDDHLEVLRESEGVLSWTAIHAPAATNETPFRSLVLGPRADITALALRGSGRLVVAKSSGQLHLLPENAVLVPPRAREHLFHYEIGGLWATDKYILFQESGGRTDAMWQAYVTSTSAFRPIARGAVGACGGPLLGEYAAALHGQDHRLVRLSLQGDQPPLIVGGNPMEASDCVAGADGLVVVTGRSRGYPAIAVYQSGQWQLVRFPLHPSLVSAFVKDDRIVVALPEERASSPTTGQTVAASGAVYVLERSNGSWRIRERIVAATPRDHGLFGFSVDFSRNTLFINHMVPGAISSDTADLDRIGDPVICEIPWASTP